MMLIFDTYHGHRYDGVDKPRHQMTVNLRFKPMSLGFQYMVQFTAKPCQLSCTGWISGSNSNDRILFSEQEGVCQHLQGQCTDRCLSLARQIQGSACGQGMVRQCMCWVEMFLMCFQDCYYVLILKGVDVGIPLYSKP